MDEVRLHGGRVTEGVVRVGDTVRRPQKANTAFVRDLLSYLEDEGFDGAPRSLGADELGRETFSYLPGEVPAELDPDLSDEVLDPLQSLDDVNLLGLVDTLRRTKAVRQLVVSTHDQRFTNLLQRKLRPVGDDGQTRVFTFSDWDEQGPRVQPADVRAEEEAFRVAAA